jgi:hypothetical protein
MPDMPERHSKDCKVSVGSKTTAHRREIRLDFSATDARVQCPLWVKSGHFLMSAFSLNDVRFTPESGHVQCNSACLLCANSGHRLQLDHIIAAGK